MTEDNDKIKSTIQEQREKLVKISVLSSEMEHTVKAFELEKKQLLANIEIEQVKNSQKFYKKFILYPLFCKLFKII